MNFHSKGISRKKNMEIYILLIVYLIYSSQKFCICYPRFSEDYNVTEITLDLVSREYADKLIQLGEDMPTPCREDICFSGTNYTFIKGDFVWPEISIGYKVALRCPFSFVVPVYTTRACDLSKEGKAQWQPSDLATVCPDAPMTELLRQITKENQAFAHLRGQTDNNRKLMYEQFMRRIISVFENYRDTPITSKNIEKLLELFNQMIHFLVNSSENLSLSIARDMLTIFNVLLDDDLNHVLVNNLYAENITKTLVNKLPHIINRKPGETLEVVLSNMAIYARDVSETTPDNLKITEGFLVKVDDHSIISTPNVSLHIKDKAGLTGSQVSVAVTVIKDGNIRVSDYKWFMYANQSHSYDAATESYPEGSASGEFYDTGSLDEPLFSPTNNHSRMRRDLGSPNIGSPDTGPGVGPQESSGPKVTLVPKQPPSSSTAKSKNTGNLKTEKLTRVGSFEAAGSTIFFTSPQHANISESVDIVYDFHRPCGINTICLNEDHVCVKTLQKDSFMDWAEQGCTTIDTGVENGYTSCRCTGLGAFAVFYETADSERGGPGINDLPAKKVENSDISSFLGFQYKKELEILGHVLGAISLACLIATVVSHVVFVHTRKGKPTKILINLCVALIALSVLLFGIYFASDLMNIAGCTVSNTLRYYLVFVTLVWNGIEAFNLYLMLVKVFDIEISRFMLKAGLIAWGVPGLMVAVSFAVNKKSFNGKHVLMSEKLGTCTYKCQLNSDMLYYGYLVPMGVIIIHNLIMFAFVLRTILKHGSKLGKAQKKSKLVQLSGAVATLVLLGVPWIFSAFGAIDATTSEHLARTEGVFQVAFVIFINLQGMFIFLFHCARNAQMRQSWSSVIRGSTTQSTLGSTKHSSVSLNSQSTTVQNNPYTKEEKRPAKEFDKI